MKKILIIEDHADMRELLTWQVELMGFAALTAKQGSEGLQKAQSENPELIILDIMMPGMDGAATTQAIKQQYPHMQIIALTSFQEGDMVKRAMQAGAIGYLLKNVSADQLMDAVRRAASGQSSLSPEAAQVLIQKVNEPAQLGHDITDREKEILALMVEGLSNADIAEKLFVSQSTVKFHVSNVLSKLGAATRTEAVALAVKNRLVK